MRTLASAPDGDLQQKKAQISLSKAASVEKRLGDITLRADMLKGLG